MTTTILHQLALEDFERASHKRFWRDLFSRLARKCNNLRVRGQDFIDAYVTELELSIPIDLSKGC